MYEGLGLYLKAHERKYFDRNLVNISRGLNKPTILLYDCPFILEKQFHI